LSEKFQFQLRLQLTDISHFKLCISKYSHQNINAATTRNQWIIFQIQN